MMDLYIGSYGHRYSDPSMRYIGFTRESVEEAVERGIEWEKKELPGYCDIEHGEDEEEACSLCNPDIVTYGVWPIHHIRDYFSGIRECINAIKDAREDPDQITALEPI